MAHSALRGSGNDAERAGPIDERWRRGVLDRNRPVYFRRAAASRA
jgi:hypothetical protein